MAEERSRGRLKRSTGIKWAEEHHFKAKYGCVAAAGLRCADSGGAGWGRAVCRRSQELLGFSGSRGLIGESRTVLLGLHVGRTSASVLSCSGLCPLAQAGTFPPAIKPGVLESKLISGSE